MIQFNDPGKNFMMPRACIDRRMATQDDLPYMSEEGMVMIDRRELADRRTANVHGAHARVSARPRAAVF